MCVISLSVQASPLLPRWSVALERGQDSRTEPPALGQSQHLDVVPAATSPCGGLWTTISPLLWDLTPSQRMLPPRIPALPVLWVGGGGLLPRPLGVSSGSRCLQLTQPHIPLLWFLGQCNCMFFCCLPSLPHLRLSTAFPACPEPQ